MHMLIVYLTHPINSLLIEKINFFRVQVALGKLFGIELHQMFSGEICQYKLVSLRISPQCLPKISPKCTAFLLLHGFLSPQLAVGITILFENSLFAHKNYAPM